MGREKETALVPWAAELESARVDEDTLFIELKTGSQFSGLLRSANIANGLLSIEIGLEGSGQIVIVALSEIAAMGINCAWLSPVHRA